MKTSRRLAILLTLPVALAVTAAGCSDDDPVAPAPPALVDLVQTAVAAGDFQTLVAAVQAAGLVDALTGPGPLTVFAPTDAAFAALPAGTLDDLLLPENQDQLIDILTYHVVSGRLLAADVLAATSLTTLQGQDVTISLDGGTPRVNDSAITATDVEASNGVIHVIDAVLIPPQ